MAKNKQKKSVTVEDLLRDLMIVQLGLGGLGQHQIRAIVGVDIHRVSRIVKHLKKSKD
jgi:hypothetical protein